MTRILRIESSIRSADQSVTRALGTRLAGSLATATGAEVVVRDLADSALPLIDSERFAAGLTAPAERSDRQHELARIGDELIAELADASHIVIGAPIYNFGAPATLKAWADLVARAGTTFSYTENGPVGLLTGKKAFIVVASGGTPVNGEVDLMTPWLVQFLRFIGITDVEIVAADGIMGIDGEEKIRAAHRRVELLAA